MPFPLALRSNPTYPEVQIQVPTASKLPVADLEGNGHPVVGVQHLVEALARVRSELNVVRIAEYHAEEEHQEGIGDARHGCGVAASRGWCWSWSVWMRLFELVS
jgi:hypothetical protein